MMAAVEQRFYTFSEHTLDSVECRLLGPDGKPIPLSSRAFDVLQYLVQHRGEVITKGTLMAAVWPDTIVEENNLNQAVATVRKALGETPEQHRFILTIPGRGYRFVSEVKTLASLQGAPPEVSLLPEGDEKTNSNVSKNGSRPLWLGAVALSLAVVIAVWVYRHWEPTPPQPAVVEQSVQAVTSAVPTTPEKSVTVVGAPLQSVAVLPFADMSPGKDQEYFADGVAEEILNQLSRVQDLFVVGRTSSFSFKGRNEDLRIIGEKLGVSHILEGSVRKEGNRVRVSAQLVKAADGYHLWSQTYDRTLEDIFAIQEEISTSVAQALQVSLGLGEFSRPGWTHNVEAYEEYLLGRSEYIKASPQSLLKAVEHYQRAIAIDPAFILARTSLVQTFC